MLDTSPEVLLIQVKIWRTKPFAERMRLGAALDKMSLDAARELAARNHPDDPAALFLSLHGAEFEPDERERIANAFRTR